LPEAKVEAANPYEVKANPYEVKPNPYEVKPNPYEVKPRPPSSAKPKEKPPRSSSSSSGGKAAQPGAQVGEGGDWIMGFRVSHLFSWNMSSRKVQKPTILDDFFNVCKLKRS